MATMADSQDTDTPSCRLQRQFDLTQWYYWSVYWQQTLWRSYNNTNNMPFYPNPNPPLLPSPIPQPPAVGIAHNPLTVPVRRTIHGYETCITSTWRRIVAEFIDILLISLILKWYFPDLDYRVPESIFLGSDVVLKMSEAELEEMGWTVLVFVSSILLERLTHLVMEVLCTHLYGCTPGKYLLGLRIYHCTRVQLTRTCPGYSIRILPGSKMGFWRAFTRAFFKLMVNFFCPLLIVFFIALDRGRTQYDRAFNCVIVNVRELYRPVYTNNNNNVN